MARSYALFMRHFSSLLPHGPVAGLLLILLWLAGPAAQAQAPAWTQLSTGVPVSSRASSYVQASAADETGNVYVSGYFYGSVRFGTTVLTSDATTTSTATDGFVAKWNSATGAFVWAVGLGGSGNDEAPALAVSNGSVYVGGFFTGPTATFGAFSLTTAGPFAGAGFVAKLTAAGPTTSFVWVRQLSGTSGEVATSLAVSGSSVYVSGSFSSPTLAVGSTVLTNAGATDTFVARLTDAGTTASFSWALSFGSTGFDEAHGLAVSGSSLYLVGDFTSPILSLGTTALVNVAGSGGTADVFITKLADAGTSASVVWAQRAGGTEAETGDAIAVSGTSLYVTGSFASVTATVGTFVLTNTSSGTGSTSDVFVARFTDAGPNATASWIQAAGGIGSDRPKGVAVRGINVYVAGYCGYPTANFGSTVLTNRGTGLGADIFVAKLTDTGPGTAFTWAQSAGGTSGEAAYSVTLTGNLVVAAGGTAPAATFGPLAVPPGAVSVSAFLASLTDPTLLATTAARGTLSFSLFPNPARAAATVQLPAVPGATTATLTLTDALGRVVRTETVPSGGRHELNLRGLAPGLYAVQVQADNSVGTQRLVVE
jgi:hypothetical protein